MKPIITLHLFLMLFIANFSCAQSADKLDAQAFNKALKASPQGIVLDVRSEAEFKEARMAKSVNINYNAPNFLEQVSKLDKKKDIFVYCAGGVRSARAADLMRANGFKHVIELKGGLQSWQQAGLPVEK
jgi:rhodanese-related sulfurtransferase